MVKGSAVGRMLAASLMFSLMAVLVKMVGERLSPFEIILWRSVLPLPLLVWILRRRGLRLVAKNRRLVVVRAVTGTTAMGLFFYALSHLPIADAMMLTRLQPAIVIILSALFLSEGASILVIACLVVSLAGTAMVLEPSLAVGNLAGLAAVGCAIASGVAHVVIRRLSADDHPTVIVFNFVFLAALMVLPAAIVQWHWPSPTDLLLLAGIAVLATAGQLLITSAYALDAAPAAVTVSYAQVALGVLWGALFWSEIPGPAVWAGGLLIVGAGLLLFSRRRGSQAGIYRVRPVAERT